MKNVNDLIQEFANKDLKKEKVEGGLLRWFAMALLAELVVEKKEPRMTDSLTGQMQILTWNACVDAYEEKKKTLLS